MRRTIYTCLFLSLACASVLAQDLPLGDGQTTGHPIWSDAAFTGALTTVIGWIIGWLTSKLKGIPFVLENPKVAAALISMLASGFMAAIGVYSTTAWGLLLFSSINQLGQAVLAFEVAIKKTKPEARRRAQKKKATTNPYRTEDDDTQPL